ncbi:hypothetical protein EDD17DRAFT_488167 [Pisolithus thermaeus]|nr:hypothetical protein EDD17DRAFT_488167 [Pisolithus thermaeus]
MSPSLTSLEPSSTFMAGRKLDDLGEVVASLCDVLELRPSGHAERLSLLLWLALCLSIRHKVLADLEKAVSFARAALDLCPPGHTDHGVSLNALAGFCFPACIISSNAAIARIPTSHRRTVMDDRSATHVAHSTAKRY